MPDGWSGTSWTACSTDVDGPAAGAEIPWRGDLQRSLEQVGEAGAREVSHVVRALSGVDDPPGAATALTRLKDGVYRVVLTGAPWPSLILKRLEPAVGQRTRLLAERWLPALGLADRCAALLGVAADPRARCVWHLYQDLGRETLADRPDRDRVAAAVDLVAELHTRAARHPILPDVRRYGPGLGMDFFVANVRDAIAALDGLAASGVPVPEEHTGLAERLHGRLHVLLADATRRARAFRDGAGPDTLLHGDLWPINAFVDPPSEGAGLRARLVDWDRAGVGPFSYDLSTFLFRFPVEERCWIVERYRCAVARAGWELAPGDVLDVLFDTAERARYANRVIWPAVALVRERAPWGFPELAEVERWFQGLDGAPG